MESTQAKIALGLLGVFLLGLAIAIVFGNVWLGVVSGVPLIILMLVDAFDVSKFGGGGGKRE